MEELCNQSYKGDEIEESCFNSSTPEDWRERNAIQATWLSFSLKSNSFKNLSSRIILLGLMNWLLLFYTLYTLFLFK